ncbi:hypothetical protein C2E23DRAFT_40769 [Lenzites betulinus]|nr:hypothetical protein C2E23DRAFT_40769 [Lenzites betulinus]
MCRSSLIHRGIHMDVGRRNGNSFSNVDQPLKRQCALVRTVRTIPGATMYTADLVHSPDSYFPVSIRQPCTSDGRTMVSVLDARLRVTSRIRMDIKWTDSLRRWGPGMCKHAHVARRAPVGSESFGRRAQGVRTGLQKYRRKTLQGEASTSDDDGSVQHSRSNEAQQGSKGWPWRKVIFASFRTAPPYSSGGERYTGDRSTFKSGASRTKSSQVAGFKSSQLNAAQTSLFPRLEVHGKLPCQNDRVTWDLVYRLAGRPRQKISY